LGRTLLIRHGRLEPTSKDLFDLFFKMELWKRRLRKNIIKISLFAKQREKWLKYSFTSQEIH
jgi:hypothetical protein